MLLPRVSLCRMSFTVYVLLNILTSLNCFCLALSISFEDNVDAVILLRRQTHEERPTKNQLVSKSRSQKRLADSPEAQDRKSLKVAKTFFENDDMYLVQAIRKHKLHTESKYRAKYQQFPSSKQSQRAVSPVSQRVAELESLIAEPSIYGNAGKIVQSLHQKKKGTEPSLDVHNPSSSLATFSKDVIRRRGEKGYRSIDNRIALSAKAMIKSGKANTNQEALQMAHEKFESAKDMRRKSLASWRKLAKDDPNKAGQMKQNVPKNLSQTIYVPARAHQLYQRGRANTMREARSLAMKESEHVLSMARERQARKKASDIKQSKP